MGEAALILEADNADEERSNQMTARPCQERAYSAELQTCSGVDPRGTSPKMQE